MMLLLNQLATINLIALSLLLVLKKSKEPSIKILALIIFIPAISFLTNALVVMQLMPNYSLIFFLSLIGSAISPVLIHLYISLYCKNQPFTSFQKLWLLIPIITISLIIGLAIDFYLKSNTDRVLFFQNLINGKPHLILFIFNTLSMISYFLFAILSYRIYQNYNRKIAQFENSILLKQNNLFLKLFLSLSYGLALAVFLIYFIFPLTSALIYAPCLVVLVYLVIVYFGLHTHSIFDPENGFLKASLIPPEKNHEENNLGEILSSILSELDSKMHFKQSDLTLSKFSEQIGISSNKVTLAINSILKKTFNDLINQKRVELAEKLLIEKHYYSVEAVGQEAGFSSRATFFRVFKKTTLLTPTQYKMKHLTN